MQHTVVVLSVVCPSQPNCMPHCEEDGCHYLCRHMISCTCYDYQHGHLCKHSHKVYSLHLNSTATATSITTDCTIISSPPSPSEEPPHIGVVHPRANTDKTGITYIEHKYTISHYQHVLCYVCDNVLCINQINIESLSTTTTLYKVSVCQMTLLCSMYTKMLQWI